MRASDSSLSYQLVERVSKGQDIEERVLVSHTSLEQRVWEKPPGLTFGRGEGNKVKNIVKLAYLDFPLVSKEHGSVYLDEERRLVFKDTSKNGSRIWVAGKVYSTESSRHPHDLAEYIESPFVLFPRHFQAQSGQATINFGIEIKSYDPLKPDEIPVQTPEQVKDPYILRCGLRISLTQLADSGFSLRTE